MISIEGFSENKMNAKKSHEFYYSESPTCTEASSLYSTNIPPSIPSTPKSLKLYNQYSYKDLKDNISSPIFSLTLENISKVQLADPTNTPLARYYNELNSSSPFSIKSYSESVTTQSTLKKRRRQQEDKVVESPRVLSFPYHNDSYFLPTAEHDYPGAGGSLMMTDTNSASSVSLHTFGSRQMLVNPLSNTYYPSYRRQKVYSITSLNNENKASSSGLIQPLESVQRASIVTPASSLVPLDGNTVSQKKRRSTPSPANQSLTFRFKQRWLRLKTNKTNDFNFISSFAVIKKDEYENQEQSNRVSNNVSWYSKILKFFKPTPKSQTPVKMDHSTSSPVWYSQFKCNPPPPPGMSFRS